MRKVLGGVFYQHAPEELRGKAHQAIPSSQGWIPFCGGKPEEIPAFVSIDYTSIALSCAPPPQVLHRRIDLAQYWGMGELANTWEKGEVCKAIQEVRDFVRLGKPVEDACGSWCWVWRSLDNPADPCDPTQVPNAEWMKRGGLSARLCPASAKDGLGCALPWREHAWIKFGTVGLQISWIEGLMLIDALELHGCIEEWFRDLKAMVGTWRSFHTLAEHHLTLEALRIHDKTVAHARHVGNQAIVRTPTRQPSQASRFLDYSEEQVSKILKQLHERSIRAKPSVIAPLFLRLHQNVSQQGIRFSHADVDEAAKRFAANLVPSSEITVAAGLYDVQDVCGYLRPWTAFAVFGVYSEFYLVKWSCPWDTVNYNSELHAYIQIHVQVHPEDASWHHVGAF
eukprot:gnl/MRDRNA2_/MRDRNA2_305643_c0_seq1.p1 gnl/MRDRNA2_/MRDRNA2_305643_c0~~gnl/MRDRNA2_/MRDRNA2_305643_c0_seq1.p1  ORF type:complete len:396 (-),score=53.44 gnl/MRDRNA2_/MRDRNA2_305643_c0_seq1:90-1277(-)